MAVDVEVFNVPQRSLCFATLTRSRPRVKYLHTFGGRPTHEGIIPPGCTRPLVYSTPHGVRLALLFVVS